MAPFTRLVLKHKLLVLVFWLCCGRRGDDRKLHHRAADNSFAMPGAVLPPPTPGSRRITCTTGHGTRSSR